MQQRRSSLPPVPPWLPSSAWSGHHLGLPCGLPHPHPRRVLQRDVVTGMLLNEADSWSHAGPLGMGLVGMRPDSAPETRSPGESWAFGGLGALGCL